MGAFMKEDDIYIGGLLELFNLRFAPTPLVKEKEFETAFGGFDEIYELQKEFKIFQPKRPFSASASILGLGGMTNARAKNRWFELLKNLPDGGDQMIADAIRENLEGKNRLPCYMKAHLCKPKSENRVIITSPDRPLFYLEVDYLTISLPMAPKRQHKKPK
jgi:hypothetical protein